MGALVALKAWYCDSTHRYPMTDAVQPLIVASANARKPSTNPKADLRQYFMLAHGSHLVDTARFMCGEIVAVRARLLERAGAYCWFVETEFANGVGAMCASGAYGAVRGDIPTLHALATLAYDGRRGEFFESQLIAALKIIANGDVSARGMTGSWAGAMGHTQFIPTSYLAYAVDFTGDGKRDIWSEDPTDSLASTAAYLKNSGWQRGLPWGGEVRLPEGFNPALLGRGKGKSAGEWTALGVTSATGGAVPAGGSII
eukprot:gene6323-7866_t